MPCSSLAEGVRALQQSKNRKENDHVENLVSDVAIALRRCNFVCQSCDVYVSLAVLRTTSQDCRTDRCTAAARLM